MSTVLGEPKPHAFNRIGAKKNITSTLGFTTNITVTRTDQNQLSYRTHGDASTNVAPSFAEGFHPNRLKVLIEYADGSIVANATRLAIHLADAYTRTRRYDHFPMPQ